MPARILDGKALAEAYREKIATRVRAVVARGGQVRLDAILVGTGDTAARVYALNQGKTCATVGIGYKLHELGTDAEPASYDDIAGRVLLLNTQEHVHAIMLHMPLPAGIDPYSIQKLIDPDKDVEGVNPANIGNVVYGRSSLAPCTGLAVIKMLGATGVPLRGKKCLVIGASDVVGKPIAVLLMRTDATVISANKFSGADRVTRLAREADVIVAAAGVPGLVTPAMVKPGAIVVDVGVNRVPGPDGKTRTVGDVLFEPVRDALGPDGWISPVPGGVGPMTVTMLLLNVVRAAERAVGIQTDDE
jgi:methylenetetrahydrofolate dehydrogenase (NADP+)/methenyltetrahydrofolate cyclohydrolase